MNILLYIALEIISGRMTFDILKNVEDDNCKEMAYFRKANSISEMQHLAENILYVAIIHESERVSFGTVIREVVQYGESGVELC
jgi:hypothetical protein